MPMPSWIHFKSQFKRYAVTTPGIFTVFNVTSLRYFDLDTFLENCVENTRNNIPLTLTKIEMLMAFSTFMDIQEMTHEMNVDIVPRQVILNLRRLIRANLIQFHPHSILKKRCVSAVYNDEDTMSAAAA